MVESWDTECYLEMRVWLINIGSKVISRVINDEMDLSAFQILVLWT